MDITQKLQSFIAQYTGVLTGDTPQNQGQCVGLIEKWLDSFNLSHIWGNAADLLSNADPSVYTVVHNTPTNSPSPGDIFVFGSSYGGGLGHTGIVTSADVNTITLFEQNDPLGSPPQLKTYTYTGAIGWIHPNIFTPTTNQTVTDQQVTDQLNAQIQATSSCQQQLKTANDTITTLQTQQQKDQNLIESLQGKLSDANTEITTLQKQLQSEQSEIVHLNQTIETQANSNKNYGQEILDLTHQNQDLKNYLNSTSDTLGLTRTGEKDADIQEHILEKLSEVDLLLKAAGLAQGLLHQVAKTFSIDAPDDKTAANNIISYVKQLGGKLQSLVPQNQQTNIEDQIQQPSFWSKFISLWWKPKST